MSAFIQRAIAPAHTPGMRPVDSTPWVSVAVGTVNYCYKMVAAVGLSPLLYLSRAWIEKYLGYEEAARLKAEAAA